MEWWFRDRYRLAPTDPRFLDATAEEMLTDYWAAHHDNLRKSNQSEEEFEDEDFDLAAIQAEMENEADWEDVPAAGGDGGATR